MMSEEHKKYCVYPGALFVDRLYALIAIDDHLDRLFINGQIEGLIASGALRRGFTCDSDEKYWKVPFWEKYILDVQTSPIPISVAIYIKPKPNKKAKRQGYIKFDFAPGRIRRKEHQKLVRRIVRTILPFKSIDPFRHAWATRIDIATDQLDISPNGFLLNMSGVKQSNNYMDVEKENVQTMYVGGEKSPVRGKSYDKPQQLRDIYQIDWDPEFDITRHEITQSKHIPLKGLISIKNPFERLSFISTELSRGIFSPDFRRLARYEGLPKAIDYGRSIGVDYREALENYRIELFDTGELWNQWPTALRFLKIFKRDTFLEEEGNDDGDD